MHPKTLLLVAITVALASCNTDNPQTEKVPLNTKVTCASLPEAVAIVPSKKDCVKNGNVTLCNQIESRVFYSEKLNSCVIGNYTTNRNGISYSFQDILTKMEYGVSAYDGDQNPIPSSIFDTIDRSWKSGEFDSALATIIAYKANK